MFRAALVSWLALTTVWFSSVVFSQDAPGAAPPVVKIGVYESRAIAVAWAASKYNPVSEKMQEMAEAKKANDARRVAQLETWGQTQQQRLHFQGFGRVPVSDLLQPVHQEMRQLMRDKGLVAITMQCDVALEGVELIDVTMDLVQFYSPSVQTLNWIRQLGDREPLPLDELAKLPAR
ncbi:MAG TPA: hypothetical protein PKD54_01420 [Pirellulaceae bacterium]|nr:hypothetical protein [Pirellulaceae bacterium]